MKVNDLEDKIMKVWSTSDDIDILLNWISDHVLIYDVEADAGEDELMNLLIGIKSLHHQRCHVLFRDFEKVLANERPTQTAADELANASAAPQFGRDVSSDDEVGMIATAIVKAEDGEDFTTYAPSGAPIRTAEGLLVDGKVPAPEWT